MGRHTDSLASGTGHPVFHVLDSLGPGFLTFWFVVAPILGYLGPFTRSMCQQHFCFKFKLIGILDKISRIALANCSTKPRSIHTLSGG